MLLLFALRHHLVIHGLGLCQRRHGMAHWAETSHLLSGLDALQAALLTHQILTCFEAVHHAVSAFDIGQGKLANLEKGMFGIHKFESISTRHQGAYLEVIRKPMSLSYIR